MFTGKNLVIADLQGEATVHPGCITILTLDLRDSCISRWTEHSYSFQPHDSHYKWVSKLAVMVLLSFIKVYPVSLGVVTMARIVLMSLSMTISVDLSVRH